MGTLEGMRATSDSRALPEARNVIKEALVARGSAKIMDPVEEIEARRVAKQKTLEVAMSGSVPPEAAKKLSRVGLETSEDAFRRALTNDPAVDVKPLKIASRRDESLERLNRNVVCATVEMDGAKAHMHGLVDMARQETGGELLQCLQVTNRSKPHFSVVKEPL